MSGAQFAQLRDELKNKPKSVLAAARRGSLPDLVALSNVWPEVADIIKPTEALDVFLVHLKKNQVPEGTGPEVAFGTSANRAFQSLLGVSKMGGIMENNRSLATRLVNAWPGIFAWSIYLYKTRIETLDKTDARRKTTLGVLSASWYTMSINDLTRKVIVDTPRTLEIATKLWIEEDESTSLQANIPPGTCLLHSLLKYATNDSLKRVHNATGNNATLVAKLAVTRIKNTCKAKKLNAGYLMMYIDLVNSLGRSNNWYIFRNALLSANVIWAVTSALVKIGNVINSSDDLTLVDSMVAGFGYLYNHLEATDGFTWVSQAIGAGLLQAFCDCSPKLNLIHKEDLDMILSIFNKILPRYLVYRSVLESIDHSMKKVDCDPHRKWVMSSLAKEVWYDLRSLADERFVVTLQATVLKDTHLTCDNVKCQKVGTKEDMRACSACLYTYYCSKECQETAWKEGDHKTMCKMKQQERLEGKSESISKKDARFFHDLTVRDARKRLPHLRGLLKKEYPTLSYHDVVIKVDYYVNPPTYKITPLAGYTTGPTAGTANAEARNVALIEKVQQNREKFALLESRVACGEGITCVLTLVTGEFWTSDDGLIGGGLVEGENDGDANDEDMGNWNGTALDGVDVLQARRVLNGILRAMGEKQTF